MKAYKAMPFCVFAAFSTQAGAVNLIVNGGFEESNTPMDPVGYMYVNGERMPTGWNSDAIGTFVRINAAGSLVWNAQNWCIAGDYSVGFQRDGWAKQTVTIPADGYYELSWRSGKRSSAATGNHTLNVKVDGVTVYTSLTSWLYWENRSVSTGPLWMTAGTHDIGFYGVKTGTAPNYDDTTTFVDEVRLEAYEATDVEVAGGTTYEVGYPPPRGKLSVAENATVTVGASSHGLLGTYRRLPISGGNDFAHFAGMIYSQLGFQQAIRSSESVETHFVSASDHEVFAVGDEYAGTLPEAFKEGGESEDNWSVEWESVLTVPASGLYAFRATVDDAFLMTLDRRNVLQSQDCMAAMSTIYLEKGPHECYIGLLDNLYGAALKLEVKGPGDADFKGLPLAWFTPLTGPRMLVGGGDVAPGDGTALVVAQQGFSTAFTGRLAGNGTGAFVFRETGNGQLDLSDVTGGVPYLMNGELSVTAPGRTLEAAGSAYDTGTLGLMGVQGVQLLYGGQSTTLGGHLYAHSMLGDDTCGISTSRTYTHLKSFPLRSTDYPTVNGVTFDNRGEMDGAGPSGVWSTSSGWTGVKSLFNTFNYGNGTAEDARYAFVLKGLTPGKVYDYRFYFLAWSSGGRVGTITFKGQDLAGNDVTIDTATFDFDAMFGSVAQESRGVIGCRYVAGADGRLVVEVSSAKFGDTIHCYAFSNELVNDTAVTSDTVTLSPPEGARASLLAALTGTDKVVVDGAGEQVFGGAVTLRQPVDVRSRLILTRGADVRSGVNLGGNGTLEMRGGSKLDGLAGAGTVDFRWGDRHPFGALQNDGTFSNAPAFRVEHFTCDANSGVSPTKTYLVAFNYTANASYDVPVHDVVNEVGFKRLSANINNGRDFRTAHVAMNGVPQNMHSGNEGKIGLDASQGFYTLFRSLGYANGWKGLEKYITIVGLSVGKTYEVRFYERLWDEASVDTRRVRFAFYTDEAKKIAEDHEVSIDREALTGPYYIAIRFTAQSSNYTIVHQSRTDDTWHLYAATLEKVNADGERRVLDFANDTTFAGSVTGCGFVEKRGAGQLTLSGASVDASGFWSVTGGAVLLGNAAATLGEVSVGAEGAFGGCGRVAEDLGVAAGGTLVLGGGLSVGGKIAVGEGAKVVVNGKLGVAASAIKLPRDLTVQFDNDGIDRLTLFASDTALEGVDTSAWRVLRADGSEDKSMRIFVRPDGKSVRVTNGGFTLFIR